MQSQLDDIRVNSCWEDNIYNLYWNQGAIYFRET